MEADVALDPEDVSLFGAAAVAAQAGEPADAVEQFRHEFNPRTGMEERRYYDRGHGGWGKNSVKKSGEVGLECVAREAERPLQL